VSSNADRLGARTILSLGDLARDHPQFLLIIIRLFLLGVGAVVDGGAGNRRRNASE
jgi:hypothetical protein